jgi:electron-transferring-flavoprotein dehydrogenase
VGELNEVDVLFVGAGPASLAGAIRLKQILNQKGRRESVVVIEKADKLGQHNLSGAVFEADVLDDLLPGWREKKDTFVSRVLSNRVERDEIIFLWGSKSGIKLPEAILPSYMKHKGNYVISVSELVNWLGDIARESGVEIYTGFTGKEVVVEDDVVKGIKLGDKGLHREGSKQSNYLPGETINAKVTVFGDGSAGLLAEDLVKRFSLTSGKNPQVYSLGVKEIIRLPEKNSFGPNRVVHTLGFPNSRLTPDVFGGGMLYSQDANTVVVGLILALDWRYCDLNPQRELQIFKSHPWIRRLLEGGETIAYGAKTIPEGGYYSVPKVWTNGAVIIGDAAGLTSIRKLKGMHYAIKSGMLVADAISRSIERDDFSEAVLEKYGDLLDGSFIMKDLYAARNYRQVFARAGRAGLYLGMPLSLIQHLLPFRVGANPDYQGMRRVRLRRNYAGGIDRLTAVSLSGTAHREDEPSHITFAEDSEDQGCYQKFGCHPCEFFCPGEVYSFEEDKLHLSPSNCLHCQTCRLKCPRQVIRWTLPEGGDGPRYRFL